MNIAVPIPLWLPLARNRRQVSGRLPLDILRRGRITPRSHANLENWWDADDTLTIDLSGDDVIAWRDKQGNLDFVDPGAGNRPFYSTGVATLNGRNAVQFDCTATEHLATTNTLNTAINEDTSIVVARFPAVAGNGDAWGMNVAGGPALDWGFRRAVSMDRAEFFAGGATDNVDAIRNVLGISTTDYIILVLRRSIANDILEVWVNGGSRLDASTGYTVTGSTTNPLIFGAGGSPAANHYSWSPAEFVRYGRVLSFAEIDSLCFNYFFPKFGAGVGQPTWLKMAA